MESVLLVEDELLIAIGLTESLEDAGFLVHHASDVASALAVARTVGFSAAIIDMGLPDGRGDSLARQLRAQRLELPILICTGYDVASLVEATKDIGVRLIEKPIQESALIAALREHMQTARSAKGSPISERTPI